MATKRNHAKRYRKVPEFLRQLREAAGLTQRAFAARVEESQWWVARSESGSRRLDVVEFLVWCNGCGLNPKQAIDQLHAVVHEFL